MQTRESILAGHSFFRDLQPAHLQVLAGCAANVRFNTGQIICKEGDEADYFYLIRHGRVVVEIEGREQTPVAVQALDPNEVLGWSWLVPPHRWRFQARAVEDTRALALDGKCLRTKCEEDRDLGYELLKRFVQIMAQRLEATRWQLADTYDMRTLSN